MSNRSRLRKLEWENERLRDELNRQPSGDPESQAVAWSVVYKTCESVGLLSFVPEPLMSGGRERVCQFIKHLAAECERLKAAREKA